MVFQKIGLAFLYVATTLQLGGLPFVAGCSLLSSDRPASLAIQQITVDVVAQANNDTPIALDFVLVRTKELALSVNTLSAKSWFADKHQWLIDHSGQVDAWSYELVPGQHINIDTTPFDGERASALFVFANYQLPGAFRLRLENKRKVVLRLDKARMVLTGATAVSD